MAKTTNNGNGGVRNKGGSWVRFHAKLNHVVDNFYYRLGFWVARHTKATLAISLLFVIICSFGFMNFTIETDDTDFAAVLFESPLGEDGNLLTKDTFDKLWEIHAKILALETGKGNSFTDLCTTELDGVTCEESGRAVTRFWGSNFTAYEASVADDSDLLAALNVDEFPDGQEVNLDSFFGSSITYNEDGDIVEAAAMTQMYLVENSESGETKEEALAWQQEFQDLFADDADSYSDTFTVVYFTGRSIDDALEESVTGEIFLFITTYCIMVVFVMIAIGRCCAGSVRRRSWLGLGGVGLVVASGLAAYGLNSAFEIPFTSLSQILPFILIGIGVDDMFVIVAAFDHTDPTLEVEERVALALKRCGVSITYTSLTNFLAFMLGSLTTLPAVEYFCLYAGTAILFDFFLQMTAFVALLTMDANRQKAGKMDWACCCTNKAFLEQEQEDRVQRGVAVGEATAHGIPIIKANGDSVHELSAIGRWMKNTYTPFILSGPGKILVLLATSGLLAAGIYGVTQVTQGFDVLDLVPDDHYVRDYSSLAREYELEFDSQYIPLNIYTREVDYPDVQVQAQIQATDDLMVEQEFVTGPVDSWLTDFVTWAANSSQYSANIGTQDGYSVYTDRDTFYTALTTFTEDGDNARFLGDLVFTEAGTIEISRTESYLIDLTDTTNNIDALEDARDVVEASTLDPEPFAFSSVFIFTEQFLVIYDELVTNFILALVAVAILSMLVLGQIAISLIVCFTVVIIDVGLLGFVYHWGLEVNSITVIELIMAVGLVVDYMVHIVHYFLHQDQNIPKDMRIADALGEIGPSVIVGACTTFVGILPMAFASNVIFRVFFKLFLCIIAFGFFHGVVFVPVALSLLPNKLAALHRVPAAPKEPKDAAVLATDVQA